MTNYCCRRCGMTDSTQLDRCHGCGHDFPFKPAPDHHPGPVPVGPPRAAESPRTTPAVVELDPPPVLFAEDGPTRADLPTRGIFYLVNRSGSVAIRQVVQHVVIGGRVFGPGDSDFPEVVRAAIAARKR